MEMKRTGATYGIITCTESWIFALRLRTGNGWELHTTKKIFREGGRQPNGARREESLLELLYGWVLMCEVRRVTGVITT